MYEARSGGDTSAERLVDGIRDLLDSPDAAYFDCDHGTVHSTELEFPQALREAASAYANQRPTACERVRAGEGAAILSERIPRRTLRELPFYREAMRPLGIEEELMLRLPGAPGSTVGISVLSERPFGERERTIVELLAAYLPPLSHSQMRAPLTPREREILTWVAEGKANKEIASLLFVAPKTVSKHLEHIYEKLGVHTRTAAVARAFGRDDVS